MLRSPLMNVMREAAVKAGKSLRRDFSELPSLQISRKGPGDFVSEADQKAERILFQELSKARPGYGFLMEESGAVEGSDKTHRFLIDPLDGTTNFLHGLAHFAISIGVERDNEMIAGLIYNPISEEMFVAEKGQGAYMTGFSTRDNQRLRVSARTDFADSVITCGIPHSGRSDPVRFLRELNTVMPRVSGVRRMGSAALDMAFVAAGRFDAYWEHNLSPWDLAAGIVIVREAGGFVSAINGTADIFATRSVVAGNEMAHTELSRLLVSAAV